MSPWCLADMGTNSANGWRSCMLWSQGAMSARRGTKASLLASSSVATPGLNSDSTLASASVKLPASTTKRIRLTSPSAAHHGLVQRFVQRVRMPGLKARRVDENELRLRARANARDAVARGLRLARGD